MLQDSRAGSITLTKQCYVERLLQQHGLPDAKPWTMPLLTSTQLVPTGEGQAALTDGTPYCALIGAYDQLMY